MEFIIQERKEYYREYPDKLIRLMYIVPKNKFYRFIYERIFNLGCPIQDYSVAAKIYREMRKQRLLKKSLRQSLLKSKVTNKLDFTVINHAKLLLDKLRGYRNDK